MNEQPPTDLDKTQEYHPLQLEGDPELNAILEQVETKERELAQMAEVSGLRERFIGRAIKHHDEMFICTGIESGAFIRIQEPKTGKVDLVSLSEFLAEAKK